MGLHLPRDSKDQCAWLGLSQVAFHELKPCDLLFFGANENLIHHVGMYVGANEFIHSTVTQNRPYIHVSNLSDPFWSLNQKYSFKTARRCNKLEKLN
jgi:cell wall-associated NlpC family hydrolase